MEKGVQPAMAAPRRPPPPGAAGTQVGRKTAWEAAVIELIILDGEAEAAIMSLGLVVAPFRLRSWRVFPARPRRSRQVAI